MDQWGHWGLNQRVDAMLLHASKEKHWVAEDIFFDATSFFAHLEKHISLAAYSIDLETYIFEDDELGRRICAQLMKAAERGVRVRVLVDGFGSPNWENTLLAVLLSAGVNTRVYHPLPWKNVRFLKALSSLNERDHRKICVVDRFKAWTGGMNISAAHSAWRDTGAFVAGTGVRALSRAFQETWGKSWSPGPLPSSFFAPKKRWRRMRRRLKGRFFHRAVRLNSSHRSRRESYQELLGKISAAKSRVWITNAYFIPPGKLIRALSAASRRAVDVKILVPEKPDVFFIHWASSAFYYGLLKNSVRIFEYLPAPLHAKTLLIDDWATVGTTNWNHRSFLHDLEVDVVLGDGKCIERMARQFDLDLRSSREFTASDWEKRSLLERIAGRLLYFFRYWI